MVLAFEVALQHKPVVAENDEPMQVPDPLVGDGLVKLGLQVRREACRLRRDWLHPIRLLGQQRGGRDDGGSRAQHGVATAYSHPRRSLAW
jgi:hypothetical protein